MLFRFSAALALVVLIAVIGAGIENRILTLKRERSRQAWQEDVLTEERTRLRLEAETAGAPTRTWELLSEGGSATPLNSGSNRRSQSERRHAHTVNRDPRGRESHPAVQTPSESATDRQQAPDWASPSVYRRRQ